MARLRWLQQPFLIGMQKAPLERSSRARYLPEPPRAGDARHFRKMSGSRNISGAGVKCPLEGAWLRARAEGGSSMSQIRRATAFMALVLLAVPALAQEESVPLEETAASAETSSAEPGEADVETSAGRVTRASFTSEIIGREPQDSITSLSNEHFEIVFFTELHDLDGYTVSHVWEREGAEMARVPFVVDGPRWRAYSTKKLEPSWTGEWTVRVEDESGRVLHTESFSYIPVAAEAGVGEAIPSSEEPPAVTEEPPAVTEELPASITGE
jgi:hypothetical protein